MVNEVIDILALALNRAEEGAMPRICRTRRADFRAIAISLQ